MYRLACSHVGPSHSCLVGIDDLGDASMPALLSCMSVNSCIPYLTGQLVTLPCSLPQGQLNGHHWQMRFAALNVLTLWVILEYPYIDCLPAP